MSRPAPTEGPDYTVDDLVADERRQTRFTLVIFLLAIVYFGGKGLVGSGDPAPTEPPSSTAPLASSGD